MIVRNGYCKNGLWKNGFWKKSLVKTIVKRFDCNKIIRYENYRL